MKRILLVEDDAAGIRMLSEFLTGIGWETIATRDCRETGALMRATNPDIVILDFMMPHQNGLQVLTELRSLDPGVPVIIMTGYATMERCREAMQGGAADFLAKSCNPDELVAALERAMKLRADQQAPQPSKFRAASL